MTCPDCFVPSIIDYIGYYENCMSEDICDEIIEYVETQRSSDLNQSTYSSHKGLSEEKQRVLMEEVWFRNGEKFYDSFKLAFNNVINNYSNGHKFFSCQRHTDFRLNKYSEGGFMSKHCDNIHHSHGQEYGFPQVSALLFLNDDYEGGEFIVAGEIYTTKKGSGIIFPSNFIYPHEVKPVIKGTRWSVLTWLM